MASYDDLHRIADAATPAARRAFVNAVAGSTTPKMRRAILTHRTEQERYDAALAVWQHSSAELRQTLAETLLSGVQKAAVSTWTAEKLAGSFDLSLPEAATFARERAGKLVTAIDRDVQMNIQGLVVESIHEKRTVAWLSREVSKVIGLHEADFLTVQRYREKLVSERLSQGVKQLGRRQATRVDLLTDVYRSKLIRQRGETIARTELIAAVNAGQEMAWEQALDRGLLAPDRIWFKTWVTAFDDRTCVYCQQLDGATAIVGTGVFDSIGGGFDSVPHPPLHPRCRCAMILTNDRRL